MGTTPDLLLPAASPPLAVIGRVWLGGDRAELVAIEAQLGDRDLSHLARRAARPDADQLVQEAPGADRQVRRALRGRLHRS